MVTASAKTLFSNVQYLNFHSALLFQVRESLGGEARKIKSLMVSARIFVLMGSLEGLMHTM